MGDAPAYLAVGITNSAPLATRPHSLIPAWWTIPSPTGRSERRLDLNDKRRLPGRRFCFSRRSRPKEKPGREAGLDLCAGKPGGSGGFFDFAVDRLVREVLGGLFGLGATLGSLLEMGLDQLERLAVSQLLNDGDLARHAVES